MSIYRDGDIDDFCDVETTECYIDDEFDDEDLKWYQRLSDGTCQGIGFFLGFVLIVGALVLLLINGGKSVENETVSDNSWSRNYTIGYMSITPTEPPQKIR